MNEKLFIKNFKSMLIGLKRMIRETLISGGCLDDGQYQRCDRLTDHHD